MLNSEHSHTTLPSFDELKALAENAPEQLEALRHDLSMAFIKSLPKEHQPQLLAQQSHIERLISKGKNPNHINVLLGQELSKQFARLADSLNKPLNAKQAADIIEFPNAQHRSSCHIKH